MNINSLIQTLNEHGMMTHAGSYHADDVLSTILLNLLMNYKSNTPFELIEMKYPQRVTVVPEDYKGFVFDIGGGKFDHHQVDAQRRINGYKYSSLGLIWKNFGGKYITEILNTKEPKIVTSCFISIDRYFAYIDLTDNVGLGESFNNLSASISSMSQCNVGFENAVNYCVPFLCTFIQTEIENAKKMIKAYEIANETKEDYFIIPEDQDYIPAKVFCGTHIRFVISKSNREGWNVNAVPGNRIEVNKEDLPGCTFLHEGKFMAVFDTKENALIAIGKIMSVKVQKPTNVVIKQPIQKKQNIVKNPTQKKPSVQYKKNFKSNNKYKK